MMKKTPVKRVVIITLGDLLGVKGKFVNLGVKYVKKLVAPYQIDSNYQPLRLSQVLTAAQNLPYQPPNKSLDDVAFIQYTGGTTGRPTSLCIY